VSSSIADDAIAWYENNGAADPSWTAADITTSADGATSVFGADLDGDGDMDIVSASYKDDAITWYKNNGAADPSWTATNISGSNVDGPSSVFTIDLDQDGDIDIISASKFDNKVSWFENNGASDPSFTFHGNISPTANANDVRSVYAADLDSDGDIDVVSANGDDKIQWYENNGSETFTEAVIATSADHPYSVFVADLDSDGDMDIVSASYYDDAIAWYENDGAADPSWTAADIATSANAATSVFVADMDNDGDL
ncbi:uncharacterized protein METZ01_LOCUS454055, partial [marine metagenome]